MADTNRIMRRSEKIFYYLACSFLSKALMILQSSCRIKHIQGEKYLEEAMKARSPAIFCLWHNNMFYGFPSLHKWFHKAKIHYTTLISLSKDGEFIAQVIEKWGSTVARGSSNRRGTEAFRLLAKTLKKKYNVAVITPDGSRGPKYKLKLGAITLAQLTGAPILPINFAAKSKWVLQSWDSFIIPKPFSKVVIQIGRPHTVPKKVSKAEKEEIRKKIEVIMVKQVIKNESILTKL